MTRQPQRTACPPIAVFSNLRYSNSGRLGPHDGDRLRGIRGRTRRRFRRDHPAVFPQRAGRRKQEPVRRLRSGHRRRPRRRSGHARAHQTDVSRTRRGRRGVRRRTSGRRICLGARSDRRHQILHLRHAGLGHADRADAARRADLRHDAPAVHPRAFFRRRPRRALSRPGRRSRVAGARLCVACRTRCCARPVRC